MVYLADSELRNKPCALKEISEAKGIPFNFLEKIFAKLKKANLVKSKKGVKGGYFLSHSAKKIVVAEIIKTLEDTMAPVLCMAEEKEKRYSCPRKRKCKTIDVWKKIQDSINTTLDSIVLADLARR